jgi:hypothetical protein
MSILPKIQHYDHSNDVHSDLEDDDLYEESRETILSTAQLLHLQNTTKLMRIYQKLSDIPGTKPTITRLVRYSMTHQVLETTAV